MKFYMHQRIFGENLIKIGLISSAQWRFPEERYQACRVTLSFYVKFDEFTCNSTEMRSIIGLKQA